MAVPQPEDDYPLCAHISTSSCNGVHAMEFKQVIYTIINCPYSRSGFYIQHALDFRCVDT
jgi:hypothetical protein